MGKFAPGNPENTVVESGQAETARHSARKNDRFKRFQQDPCDDQEAGDGRKNHAAFSNAAFNVISAFNRRETGQFAFALEAADSNAASEIPGMRAATSRWIFEMVQPASSFSSVTFAMARIFSGVKFMVPSCAESAMAKQAA